MSGSITLDNSAPPLWQPAVPIQVCKFDPSQTVVGRYSLVPNVVCEQIERSIGPNASTAHFRYILDTSGLYPDWPTQFDKIWPQVVQSGQYTCGTDERIAVIGYDPDGNATLLFDGFAQIPQVNLDPNTQRVTFTATGVECRCWDTPIGGRVQRGADGPYEVDPLIRGLVIQTDLPVRFNPSDGRGGVLPNCTPDDFDVNQDDPATAYPVFLEEHLERSPDPRTLWTVSKAVRYILATQNDGEYVTNHPDFARLSRELVVKIPVAADGTMDPTDPATYKTKDMPLRDFDCSNQSWPDALEKLLGMIGFGFYFSFPSDDGSHDPATVTLMIFRKDQSEVEPVSLMLDEFRSDIDPSLNDVSSLALARDLTQVVNAWLVETPPRRWEVSIVLACGFQPTAGDETASNRKQFLWSETRDASATIARKYRWYVADEAADGHWDGATWTIDEAFDFSSLWPSNNANHTYCQRLRPGSTHLLTLDQSIAPRRAMLHYSQDYAGEFPSLWDKTGTWKPIAKGWHLLEHRLGIEVTTEDVEMWHTGHGKKLIKGITWQANPPAGKQFWLMLTTVIDGDTMLPSFVPRRIASPTKFTRRRTIDARDHYRLDTVFAPSWFLQQPRDDKNNVVLRDDTKKALDLGRQYRTAHEMPPLSGSVTIPYLTMHYALADLVDSIAGRDVSLHVNAASDKGEGRRYPFVTKIAWSFSGDRQTTTLQLTDLRAEPQMRYQ